ncbi:MAG TPA: 1-(5-phosphoribosyl)-5-[(5-phosphoribosylamino)methylideneamino]imidazole-4-carboxamide isomerase [Anaerolineae bacterium]|nr:1-(5-phosphoribosyl)-5-[(5-phosphoribosylamino)methylideneamino]imidazole-4-carboxamide isomerase [Anaerolineae bacterium]
MKTFTLYPAIDLRHGQVVRLQYGDPDRQTTFSDDPVATAQQWLTAGTTWLHVVNLDGAFDEAGRANWDVLPALAALACVQFGGGIRTLDDVKRAMDAGVGRVIIGTAAIENPDLVSQALNQFGPDRVAVGLDARDGRLRTHGWQTDSGLDTISYGQHMYDRGVRQVIHTDISRDGVLTGVNAEASAELARATNLQVIASGGVAGPADIGQSYQYVDDGVSGLIIGRALYDGRLDLTQALRMLSAKGAKSC